MSIEDEIKARMQEGRLVLQVPQLKGESSRAVFVETELHGRIAMGANSNDPDAFRIGQMVRDLDRFTSGRLVTVGFRREKACFMKQLEPRGEEVWEIRSRDPKPSYRLFCRFALPDVLIVLTCVKRGDLGDENDPAWKAAIRDCKAQWRRLFNPYPPFQGSTISDYIQRNVVVIGSIA